MARWPKTRLKVYGSTFTPHNLKPLITKIKRSSLWHFEAFEWLSNTDWDRKIKSTPQRPQDCLKVYAKRSIKHNIKSLITMIKRSSLWHFKALC